MKMHVKMQLDFNYNLYFVYYLFIKPENFFMNRYP